MDKSLATVGVVCFLNSGSPKLTITAVFDTLNKVEVSWTDIENKVQTATFPVACLKEYVPLHKQVDTRDR